MVRRMSVRAFTTSMSIWAEAVANYYRIRSTSFIRRMLVRLYKHTIMCVVELNGWRLKCVRTHNCMRFWLTYATFIRIRTTYTLSISHKYDDNELNIFHSEKGTRIWDAAIPTNENVIYVTLYALCGCLVAVQWENYARWWKRASLFAVCIYVFAWCGVACIGVTSFG